MAPEVLDGKYDAKCDTWALGVLLYVLISGYFPFDSQTKRKIFDKIRRCDFNFDNK